MGTACSNIMNASGGRYILVQHHLADSYTYPWGTQRQTYFGVTGLPTTIQDGILRRIGAYPAATYQNDFNARRNVATNVVLNITPRHSTGPNWQIDLTATLEAEATAPRTMRMNMIQVIDQYPTPNTHWRNCMMQGVLSANTQVITLQPGESQTVTYPLVLAGASWTTIANRHNVGVVAWAQGSGAFPSSSEVYQSAFAGWRQLLPTDLNANGSVDLGDLAILLAHFGTVADATQEQGDTDGDTDVDLQDLARLLADFGT